mgnify:CR=1 FL=1
MTQRITIDESWCSKQRGGIRQRREEPAPPVDAIEIGATSLDGLTVAEIGRAEILSAQVNGIAMFVLAAVLWVVLLGWVIHLWSIVDAALWKPAYP